jgi:hypothetical protein
MEVVARLAIGGDQPLEAPRRLLNNDSCRKDFLPNRSLREMLDCKT